MTNEEEKEVRESTRRRSRRVVLVCSGCGTEFERAAAEVRDQRFVFCSRECYRSYGGPRAGVRGGRPRADYWREGLPEIQPETEAAISRFGSPKGWMNDRGYLTFLWPSHPAAAQNGRVGEHRVVAYEHVGDAIRGMHVDHDNNVRSDNRWENLRILTRQEHGRKTHERDGIGRAVRFLAWASVYHPEVVAEFEAPAWE